MNQKRTYLLLLFLSILFSPLKANHISVSSFPLSDQLPSSSVRRIYQDREGFMWLGTHDGLCRYDAYGLLTFRTDHNNPNLLTNNEITCITEDLNGHLLVGTRKGINILSKQNLYIEHFEHLAIRDQEICSIVVTDDGNIWVGTLSQVYCFNPDFTLKKQYDDSLPLAAVNTFYIDKKGNLWVMLWLEGLYYYDGSEDRFVRMPKIGEKDNPFCIYEDNRNQFWICTWGEGVFLFNPDKQPNDGMYKQLNIYSKDDKSLEKTFYSLVQDDVNGYMWLMSSTGLFAFQYTGNYSVEEVDIAPLFEESNNIYSMIIKDKEGNLWIAAYNEGLLTVNFDKPDIQNLAFPSIKGQTGMAPNIVSLYKDEDEDIWFSQNRWGLGIYYAKKNEVSFFNDIPIIQDQKDLNLVNYISGFRSMPGKIWVASGSNPIIYEITKKEGKVISLTSINLSDYVSNPGTAHLFYEDRKDNIWIATSTGLFLKPYNERTFYPVSYSIDYITGITEDTRGCIWLSSKTTGFYKLPPSSHLPVEDWLKQLTKVTSPLVSDNVETICADLKGRIWIGTKGGGLIMYDTMEDIFVDKTATFNFFGESIISIVADDYGYIWILTDKRFIECNTESEAYRGYTTTDGVLVSSFRGRSFYKDKSGKLYFGGNKGISVFSPSDMLSKPAKEIPIFISDVRINNQSLFLQNTNPDFDLQSRFLRFKPNDRNIEINFSSLNYTYPGKIRYAYKMDGVDDDWVYTEHNKPYAVYSQLKKGDHTFYIKATDENNIWSPTITQYNIYKKPRFYESKWAYAVYFICFVLAIYFNYRWVKNRISLRNRLKIAQIEKEKSEELTQTKLRYFTNITHDFLTPLTIISCLIDDAQATGKNDARQLGIMRSNVTRLKRLLQQVLDFRKIESSKMKIVLSKGDIAIFVKDICYTNFIPLMKKKNIDFYFQAVPNQIYAYFDADKIDKIVYNLLSNAYKYTPEGGTVGVEIRQTINNDSSWFIMEVRDTGIGISPEHLPNIFTSFYSSKSIPGDTNGIGLFLTKEMVTLHHGRISVQSKDNEGSVFTVEIPVDKEAYETYPGEEASIVEESPGVDPVPFDPNLQEEDIFNKKEPDGLVNILLVEDNEELILLMRNILSRHYNIFTAGNGKEAIPIVKENNIQIIISDVMMPEMDGLELCLTLKKDLETSHIPIILLTAKNSADDRVACYNAGADGYISKPFDLKVLEARIKNFITDRERKQKEFQADIDIDVSKLEFRTIDEQFLTRVVKIIEEAITEVDLDVNILAEHLHMSRSSLYRKIKTMTGLSPVELIRNIRLKYACQLLKDRSINISEVAYMVGFSDAKYFATCFRKEFNITPSEFQRNQDQ